ncbi:hypothetical protein NCCP436_28330 [Pseudomonas sp. NCCP-436]|nr:hypothetical protein NCCP436_28330 [Pseudomonas sp. NCCP-436]
MGIRALPAATLQSPTEAQRRAGIVNFSLAGWDSTTLCQRLRQERVIGILRGPGMRLSPHFYTSVSVIDETIDVLTNLAGR